MATDSDQSEPQALSAEDEASIRSRFAELRDDGSMLRLADAYARGDSTKAIVLFAMVSADYGRLLAEVDRLRAALGAERRAREAAEEALRKVAAVGHDDDCMFCGFKDRQVRDYNESYLRQPQAGAEPSQEGER